MSFKRRNGVYGSPLFWKFYDLKKGYDFEGKNGGNCDFFCGTTSKELMNVGTRNYNIGTPNIF